MTRGDRIRSLAATAGRRIRAARTAARPGGGRATLRAGALIVAGALGIAILLYGALWAGLTLAAPYLEATLHPAWNAETQAGGELTYAGVATCQSCHEPEVTKLVTSDHRAIGCESCHGALLGHALSSPGPEADLVIGTPSSELCVTCHARTEGRPADFPQVTVASHYVADCLACHNPHSGISRRPPLVVHPLDNLPACITCHGSEAFKARDIRHPAASNDDAACLACHESKPAAAASASPARGAKR